MSRIDEKIEKYLGERGKIDFSKYPASLPKTLGSVGKDKVVDIKDLGSDSYRVTLEFGSEQEKEEYADIYDKKKKKSKIIKKITDAPGNKLEVTVAL